MERLSDKEFLVHDDKKRAKRAILDHLQEVQVIVQTLAQDFEELITEFHSAEIQISRWLDVLE